ncbi:hypothetical protein WR25_23546 isoform D [Diploscapter pachys]|uniref:ShKT domain-containing protein n=1 Tax=Diploscapter pachys TaxID=2018661 RepID=A0A2A2LIH2_9BILA|nr:hypothetical protein WR25_23546 isoform B [Diploscapter pachys]PAV85951.1 hypothetical protein WR25_23546 isoform D [Diploscapter pachys]
MARDHKKKKITLPPGISSINQANAAADFASIPSQIYQCMDLDCVCVYIENSIVAPDGSCTLKDGSKVEKVVRKEIRQLSEDERQRLFKALQTLKDSGEYDYFARLHKHGDKAASAHSGPGFLGWHREFNKRMEFAIRQIDPSLSLPYYDMTLDGVLPEGEANNSVIFSKYLLGESFGVYPTNSIINGPFAGWTSTEGCPYEAGPHYTEAAHGSGHNFVGGDMSELITAAIDPIFFFFHSFVDKIWEDWRQLRQTRAEREIQYPKDNDRCAAVQHFVGANMYPFSPLKNIDGLSNKYTDNLYSYAPKPTCSRANPDGCNSEFLFCDFRNNTARCAAKVKAGTRCHYWTEENPCYLGECRNGRCVETMTKGSIKVTAAKKTNTNRKLNSQVGCYNENKCCAHWASKGECSKNVDYMNQYCKASCGQCFTSTYLLTDDCSDRHNQCSAWARNGECEKANKEWMSENCRKSCQHASITIEDVEAGLNLANALKILGCQGQVKKAKVVHPPGVDLGAAGFLQPSADLGLVQTRLDECIDFKCACDFIDGAELNGDDCILKGGQPMQKVIRREYRTLSDGERKRLYEAFWELHNSSQYHHYVGQHRHANTAAGAHAGPAFVGWHREYLKRLELSMRSTDPTLFIPYIDWTFEDALENPEDSVLFSEYLMGESPPPPAGGFVFNGPFKGWTTREGNPGINRSVGATFNGTKFRPIALENVTYLLNLNNDKFDIGFLPFPAAERGCPYLDLNNGSDIENIHGRAHLFVGGDMSDFPTSSNDPIFFMLHSFVDYLWETWRQTKQTAAQRETQYPRDDQRCSSVQHFLSANMYPFTPLNNRDGLSNNYTKFLYEYAPSPTCSDSLPLGCNSEFLFCDLSHGAPRCSSKIKPGAKCGGYTRGEEPCYRGECVGGRCVLSPGGTPRPRTTPRPTPGGTLQRTETCYNENKCCQNWAARGQCNLNPDYMRRTCPASCESCTPTRYRLADVVARTTPAPLNCDATEGCYNENACCPYWSIFDECRSNSVWMACNCRVSCGVCYPDSYTYGSCIDYHRMCRSWASQGECAKNPWMAENCRASCGTCYSAQQLSSLCDRKSGPNARAPLGLTSPVRRARVQHPTVQIPNGRGVYNANLPWWAVNQNNGQFGGQFGGSPYGENGQGGFNGFNQGGFSQNPSGAWRLTMRIVICGLLLGFAKAQDPCASAPNPTMRSLCLQIQRWDGRARSSASRKTVALPPGMAGDMAVGAPKNPFAAGASMAADFAPIAANIYQCMTLTCMCSYLQGTTAPNGQCTLRNGQSLRKAYRKEYRQLSDAERQKLHEAYWSLKNSGEYDNLARTHRDADRAESAHAGPAFPMWHREFIKRFEFALRQIDPSISLPYVDWTMDAALPNSKDSVLFSSYLMGEHQGRTGCLGAPFANWRTIEGRACVMRATGTNGTLKPMEQRQIDALLADQNVITMLGFPARKNGCPYNLNFNILEFVHGQSHLFIGGDMGDTPTSSNDPIFFLHHAYVDYVWEMWRERWQSRAEREIRYPPDNQQCSSVQHFANNNMMPFTPMKNRDGLSNMYLDNLWEYAPRPTCSAGNINGCASQFLFCDLSHGAARCVSKIKPGAPCNFYRSGESPCYHGVCRNNVCVITGPAPPTPRTPSRNPPKRILPQENCRASCGSCYSEFELSEMCGKGSAGSVRPTAPARNMRRRTHAAPRGGWGASRGPWWGRRRNWGMFNDDFGMFDSWLLLISILINGALAQNGTAGAEGPLPPHTECENMPDANAKHMCIMLREWDKKAQAASTKKKIALPPGMLEGLGTGAVGAEFAPIASTVYQCMDIACMCGYFNGNTAPNGACQLPGGKMLGKAQRKEYRLLSDEERERLHAAFWTIKKNGEYDALARIHRKADTNGGAHSGPAFLPWHREYVKRIEFALRQVDPTLHLPYIDWTLEDALENPKDTVLFSEYLLGESDPNSFIKNGPFVNWPTLEGHQGINRSIGPLQFTRPMTKAQVDWWLSQSAVENVLAFTANRPVRIDLFISNFQTLKSRPVESNFNITILNIRTEMDTRSSEGICLIFRQPPTIHPSSCTTASLMLFSRSGDNDNNHDLIESLPIHKTIWPVQHLNISEQRICTRSSP